MKAISKEIREQVIEARKAGSTYAEILEQTGVSRSTVSKICRSAELGVRVGKKKGKTCPKCKRGGFPAEYVFCPFCTTDMRSEKELVIERLERAKSLIPPPHVGDDSQIVFAILKAIEYLKHN